MRFIRYRYNSQEIRKVKYLHSSMNMISDDDEHGVDKQSQYYLGNNCENNSIFFCIVCM